MQVVPHVGAAAKQLYVFQRTPSSIDVRANRPTDPEWAAGLKPGWQRERIENFTVLTSGGVADKDLVMDGWTDIIGAPDRAAARPQCAGRRRQRHLPPRWNWPTSRRWSRSGLGSTKS